MKIIFMGTPDFAVPALRRLMSEHEVVAVYTREPKPSGRGNKLNFTPIHLLAQECGIPVHTPKSLRAPEEQRIFAEYKADVAVIAAYGLILPLPILEACPLGCLNIHASLLPRWRGAAPIQRAVEAGDEKSGVTIMQMAEGLDTGDMLLKGEVEITPQTTGGELHDALAVLGADLIGQVLQNPSAYKPQKQDDALACYAQKLDKSECKLDLLQDIDVIYNKVRAFSPYPAVYFEHKGERFKVLEAEKSATVLPAGEIRQHGETLLLGCYGGSLLVKQIQRQGKRPMEVAELLRGYSFA